MFTAFLYVKEFENIEAKCPSDPKPIIEKVLNFFKLEIIFFVLILRRDFLYF